jgi:hypothetical protein
MRLPEGKKGLFAGAVCAGNTVEIDLDRVGRRTAAGNGVRQAVCPLPDKLPLQDNPDSIA